MHTPTIAKTVASVAAAAAVGSAATTPNLDWYRSLDRPSWEPPQAAFPMVWTSLYALIAVGTGRALDRLSPAERTRFWRTFAINLGLNAGWSAVFFGARRPSLALVELMALNASNVALLRRAWRGDRRAGAALIPYVVWTGFATVLNGSIAARRMRTR
jgi:benzodiazapine receptor